MTQWMASPGDVAGPKPPGGPRFLVGIDLEALPLTDEQSPRSWEELEALAKVVLASLARRGWRATFFTVGRVAERLPRLISDIAAAGHEIGCHTHGHVRLDRLDADAFRRDLDANLQALAAAGARGVAGFRAPFFSLTERAASWVYPALREAGLRYSSSVSLSRNLSGWSERAAAVAHKAGISELTVSSLWTGPLGAPLGGLYFRVVPRFQLRRTLAALSREASYLTSFFHPHDFFTDGLQYVDRKTFLRSPLLATALSVGRRGLEGKLDLVDALGFSCCSFGDFLAGEDARRRHVRFVAASR